jgi:hypothetical protein
VRLGELAKLAMFGPNSIAHAGLLRRESTDPNRQIPERQMNASEILLHAYGRGLIAD